MRIVELFDKKADWEWAKMNDVQAEAVVAIGDVKYEIVIEEDDIDYMIAGLKRHGEPIPKWAQMISDDIENSQMYNIVFLQQKKTPSGKPVISYELTGTGNVYTVFSTVLDVMHEYGRNFNVDWWTFGAKEPSRRRMYDRLASRFAGEVFTIDDMDGDKIYVVKA